MAPTSRGRRKSPIFFFNRSTALRSEQAAFPLCVFQEIWITRWGRSLCQGPSTSSRSTRRTGLLPVPPPPFGWCSSRGRLVSARLWRTVPPASLCLSCVSIAWRISTCLRCACWRPPCSALTTPEPCHASDCATVSIDPFRGSCPRIDWRCSFLFDVLVTFLRRTREINVWQKFIFGVFFWTVFSLPNKMCILAISVCFHNFYTIGAILISNLHLAGCDSSWSHADWTLRWFPCSVLCALHPAK